MAHAAKIEDNIVREVIVIPDNLGGDENDAAIEAYIHGIGIEGSWIRTSYNAAENGFRKMYAGIGYSYDSESDVFITPRPYDSWTLDSEHNWQPPIPMPEEGIWSWDEKSRSWIEIPQYTS